MTRTARSEQQLDPYETLGVTEDAPPEAVAAAFRRCALAVHPDRHPGASPTEAAALATEMVRVNRAYQTILAARRRGVAPEATWPQADRGPGPDECSMCGHAPGVLMAFEYQSGVLFRRRRYSFNSVLCRPCAQAIGRSYQDRTLSRGVWGPTLLVTNVGVVARNARELRRAARLPGPRQVHGVRARLASPITPGRPVSLREGFWVVALSGTLLLCMLAAMGATWGVGLPG